MAESVLEILDCNVSNEIKPLPHHYIEINKIKLPQNYNSQRIKDTEVRVISESIKKHGLLQPIIVRQSIDDTYELLSGGGRLQAASVVGIKEVPITVINAVDRDTAILELVGHLKKKKFDYLEEAVTYSDLIHEYHFTQEEMASKIGKNQSTISNKLRLLTLSPTVRQLLLDNCLSERHARALLRIKDQSLQIKVLKYVCKKNLNVRATEDLINKVIQRYTSPCKNKYKASKLSFTNMNQYIKIIKQAVTAIKQTGSNAKATQRDKGNFIEFIIRVQK